MKLIYLFCLCLTVLSSAFAEEEDDAAMRAVLAKHAIDNNVALTFGNIGYVPYVLNWLHFVQKLEITNYVVFALDAKAEQVLRKAGANVFHHPSWDQGSVEEGHTAFGSNGFKRIVHKKPWLVLRALQMGFNILLSDADIVWLENPWPLFTTGFDIMSDAHYGTTMGTNNSMFVNSGFVYFQSGEMQIAFMDRVVSLLATNPDRMDQDAFNTAISNWRSPIDLKVNVLDPLRVCNGWVYYVMRSPQNQGVEAAIIHNNWADGHPGTANDIKKYRFREHLQWVIDDDSYYTAERKFLTYDHYPLGTEGPRVDLWTEVEALRSALAYARILNRTLILPPLTCRDGPQAEPMEGCGWDTLLDIKTFFEKFPNTRESSFMDNPRVPQALLSPAMQVRIVPGGSVNEEERVEAEEEYYVFKLPSSGGASEQQVREMFRNSEATPRIHITGMAGRFGEFDHPVHQLYFDKDIRFALQPNFYVTEGAKRIGVTYAPPHCPAFHIPRALLMKQSHMNRLVEILSAHWPPKMARDCVFISTIIPNRSTQYLAPLLEPLKAIWGKIYHIGEGELEYPICDLWRLGDYHLLTAMQQQFCAKATTFIYVKSPNSKSSRFERSVLRTRDEYGNRMSIQIDYHEGNVAAIERPEPPCPAPQWQDNRMRCDVGLDYQHIGKLAMAKICLKEAVKQAPKDAQAWVWLANILMNTGHDNVECAEAYKKAHALQADPAALINAGVAYQRGGKTLDAIATYREAIKLAPQYHEHYHNLGGTLDDIGEYEEALAMYDKALSIRPNFGMSWAGKARIMSKRGTKYGDAAAAWRKVIDLNPQDPQPYLDFGQYLHEQERFDEEMELYEHVFKLDPSLAMVYSYYATSFISKYQRDIGYRSYGKIPEDQNYVDRALQLYDKAIELDKFCGMCWGQRADLLKDAHKIPEAIESYRMSAMLLPETSSIFCNYVYTKFFNCDWSDYNADFDRINEIVAAENSLPKIPDYQCVLPLQAVLYRQMNASFLLDVTKMYVARLAAPLPPPVKLSPEAYRVRPDRRLRLGYLSADFKDHPVAKRMQDVYRYHDRSKVQVTCYCLNANDDSEWRKKIEAGAERFLDLTDIFHTKGVPAVAEYIANDVADVIVNLAGHTRGNDMVTQINSMKPAGVQLLHMGYAGTFGSNAITAHTTDRITSPPEYSVHYTEKLFYMPGSLFVNDYRQTYIDLTFDVTQQLPREQRLANAKLPENSGIVFAAFNQLYKVDPTMFATWMRILKRVPNSILWLIRIHTNSPEENLRKEARRHGVDPERLVIRQGYPEHNHLHIKSIADVFLDTPSYNAHSSGTDILWAGVPLLTMTGEKMASRLASGLVHALGVKELCVRNEKEYEEFAVALAKNPSMLAVIKEKIMYGKRAMPLFDTRGWVRENERGMRMYADLFLTLGSKPFHLVVNPKPPFVVKEGDYWE